MANKKPKIYDLFPTGKGTFSPQSINYDRNMKSGYKVRAFSMKQAMFFCHKKQWAKSETDLGITYHCCGDYHQHWDDEEPQKTD